MTFKKKCEKGIIDMEFYASYNGHERNARKILLEEKIVDTDALALLSSAEVTDLINKNFQRFRVDDDWLLVRKKDVKQFESLVLWCDR